MFYLSPKRPDGLYNINYGDMCIAFGIDEVSANNIVKYGGEIARESALWGMEQMQDAAAAKAEDFINHEWPSDDISAAAGSIADDIRRISLEPTP